MKTNLFLVFILITTNFFAQEDTYFTIGGEYSDNFQWRNYTGGLQLEIPIDERFSVHYKAQFGASSDGAFHLHSPIGAAFGTVLLHAIGNTNSNAVGTLGALLYAIPEGITYYPNIDTKVRFGFYLAPLGCDYWRKRNYYEYFRFSGEAGAKARMPLFSNEHWYLQVNGGVKYLYRYKSVEQLHFHGGLGLAFRIGK